MDERDNKAMNDELKSEKCCGNCKKFSFESIQGIGLCGSHKINKHCSDFCNEHEAYVYSDKKPKYRVGRANHCAILYVETGREYLVFPRGKAEHIDEFCKWLNDNGK